MLNDHRALTSILIFFSLFIAIVTVVASADAGDTQDLLYVCNGGVGNISIVDLNTNTEVASIDRPSMPSCTALSPDGALLYVTGGYSGRVYVLNATTGGVINTIDADSGTSIVLSADGRQACLMGDYGTGARANLKVLNTSTLNITATFPWGQRPRSATFSPDGSTLYVADTGTNDIRALNVRTGEAIGSIKFIGTPIGLSMSADGNYLYAAVISSSSLNRINPTDCPTVTCNPFFIVQSLADWILGKNTSSMSDADAIYQIDADNLSVMATIPLDAAPVGYAAGPGDTVYVACSGGYGSYLYIVNTSTKTLTDKIPVGINFMFSAPPVSLAVSPDGSRVLFNQAYYNNLVTVDTQNMTASMIDMTPLHPAGISVGSSVTYFIADNKILTFDAANIGSMHTLSQWWAPQHIAFSHDGSRAYVLSEFGSLLSVIDAKNNSILYDVPVGRTPKALAVSPDGSTVCVANYDDNNISVIDTQNGTILRTLYAGVWPCELTFSTDGERLYVINQDSSPISIDPASGLIVSAGNMTNSSLYVFDVKTGQVERTAQVKYTPGGIAASPDGRHIYVSCHNATNDRYGNVLVLDAKDLSLVKSIDVGASPGTIMLSPDGSRLYVIYSLGITKKIAVIDTNTNVVVTDSAAQSIPFVEFMTLSPDDSRLYVSNGYLVDGNVTAIDTANYTVASTVMTGYSHGSMTVLRR